MPDVLVLPAQAVFDLKDRDGVPFDATFHLMAERRCVCDVRELKAICRERGWNRAVEQIDPAWRDAYGRTAEEFRQWCLGGDVSEVEEAQRDTSG